MSQALTDPLALAACFFDALARGDRRAIVDCCAQDLRVWHSFDGVELDFDQTMAALDWFFRALPERRYERVSRHAFAGGFVQQHVITGTLADGTALVWPACAIGRVENGRIARVDEYMDSAPLRLFPPI